MKKKSRSAILILLFFMGLFAMAAEDITFSADKMSSRLTKGRESTVLDGSAIVDTGKVYIKASNIELYGTDFNFIKCKEAVSLKDTGKKLDLTAQELVYDRKAEKLVVRGNIELQDGKNAVVVRAGYVESDEKNEITLCQIGVRIIKKDMICRSEFARYDRKAKMLELTGKPVVLYKGDEYRAQKISINIDTDEITLDGEVSGKIENKDSKDNKDDTPKDKPKGATP